MGTYGWLALIAAGIALGFAIGRVWPSRKTKLAELEQERDQARKELGSYRDEVNAHFERTAELFDKVTADYRGLYEHLAMSARQLGAIEGEAAERSLDEPEQRRLAPADADPADETPDETADETADDMTDDTADETADKPPARKWADEETEEATADEAAAEEPESSSTRRPDA